MTSSPRCTTGWQAWGRTSSRPTTLPRSFPAHGTPSLSPCSLQTCRAVGEAEAVHLAACAPPGTVAVQFWGDIDRAALAANGSCGLAPAIGPTGPYGHSAVGDWSRADRTAADWPLARGRMGFPRRRRYTRWLRSARTMAGGDMTEPLQPQSCSSQADRPASRRFARWRHGAAWSRSSGSWISPTRAH